MKKGKENRGACKETVKSAKGKVKKSEIDTKRGKNDNRQGKKRFLRSKYWIIAEGEDCVLGREGGDRIFKQTMFITCLHSHFIFPIFLADRTVPDEHCLAPIPCMLTFLPRPLLSNFLQRTQPGLNLYSAFCP
jgi:hypothetical protein